MSVQSLRRVLTLQSLLPIILPFVVVLAIGAIWAVPRFNKDAGERQIQLAQIVGRQVESHLEIGAAMVRAAAAISQKDQRHLDSLLGSTDTMSTLYEISTDGTVSQVALQKNHQTQLHDQVGLNLSRNPLFLDLLQSRQPRWSKTFLSVISGGLVAAYGVPGAGATVIGEVDLTHLTRFLQQIVTEKELLILIVDHNGQVVADNNGRYTAQQLNISNIPLVRDGIRTDSPTIGQFDFSGSAMTGGIVHIKNMEWHVLVATTDISLYRTQLYIALFVLAGILIAVCSGVLTSIYLSKRLSERFDELTSHAHDIAEGVASNEWPTSTISEFNLLSDNLKLMARRLKDSEIQYRSLVENSFDVIFVLNADGVFQFVSPAWEKHFGYPLSDVLHKPFAMFVHPDDVQTCFQYMAQVLTTGEVAASPVYRVRQSNGRWRHFIANGSVYQDAAGIRQFMGIGRDISDQLRAEEERLNLEKQMLHTQKLESLGVLAGGIAHDFNNILTAIIGNADLAILRINKESPAVDNLHRIEQAALRAADLAKQMIAYSGKGKFVIEHVSLNTLLEDMLQMLEVSISKKAVLRINPHKQLPTVAADATQLRQIIMNLVINASEAIGDKSGVIAITTGCMECDRSYLKDVWLDENLPGGSYVYIEIADTGCGMDRDTLGKLFDPFFTTKFTGRGLGMAAVMGIVRGHKGAIKVYSELNKGTTFKILLPASDRSDLSDLSELSDVSDNWHGSGTILLVDDEETIRGIGSEMLKELGYIVITADDGREAVATFKANPGIPMVLLDLTMPHMDGEQCFRELLQLDPNLKVIMSSGYNEQEVSEKFIGKGLSGFIQKPYRLSVLKELLRNIEKGNQTL